MASRGEIKDAVYDEMVAVAGTYDVVDADDATIGSTTLTESEIGLRHPEDDEEHPQIVYHDNFRPMTHNGVGTGPDVVEYAPDGSVEREVWREYVEGQFIVDVRASDEVSKEPVYESLRTRFGRYQFDPWQETDIHEDVERIEVADSQSVDTGDADSTIRGDQLEIRVEFHRDYAFSTENIQTVNQSVDADNDGTIDETYTTTN